MRNLNRLNEIEKLPHLESKIKAGTSCQKKLEQTEKLWLEKMERVRLKQHNRK